MGSLKFIEVSKGIKIGVPVNLTDEQIAERVANYQQNLDRSNTYNYNPKIKKFVKSKF